MFQSLTPNQKLYILYKVGTPRLEEGYVQGNPALRTIPSQQYGQMPTQVVDVTVLVNGQTFNYTLPATAVVGTLRDNGGVTVSMSREAMSNEVKSLRQASVDIVNSVEYHNGVIATCDSIWQALNPEAVEKEQQKNEINALKDQMATMSANMLQQTELIRKLMEGMGNGGTVKPTKTKEQ